MIYAFLSLYGRSRHIRKRCVSLRGRLCFRCGICLRRKKFSFRQNLPIGRNGTLRRDDDLRLHLRNCGGSDNLVAGEVGGVSLLCSAQMIA